MTESERTRQLCLILGQALQPKWGTIELKIENLKIPYTPFSGINFLDQNLLLIIIRGFSRNTGFNIPNNVLLPRHPFILLLEENLLLELIVVLINKFYLLSYCVRFPSSAGTDLINMERLLQLTSCHLNQLPAGLALSFVWQNLTVSAW